MIAWLAVAYAAPEVIVLGVAQDGGHPQAGCTKACCRAAWDDPALRHHVASLAIVDDGKAWLVDATPDLPAQLHELQRRGLTLAGILLTHGHMGHYTGLLHLGREVMGADAVPVWAMPRMATLLKEEEPWALIGRLGHVQVRSLADGAPVALDERITVTPFLVPHRDELTETVGFRIRGPQRTVVWLPDIDKWERWDTPLTTLLEGADVAWLDATFYADGELSRPMSEVPHPFVVETMATLADRPDLKAKVRLVHLNHTNPALDPSSAAARAVTEVGLRVAREGDREPL
ncbi:MAG: MBL fold metallo-hydrolase [Alphaproteobacteria bacterium]|nr:MBL fold metallo-hydrolase [Alphaproteobacteria bacterium]MCB9697424.1 MBL fold metallo-hydrolase [Alphaproteobacteria bacterium]